MRAIALAVLLAVVGTASVAAAQQRPPQVEAQPQVQNDANRRPPGQIKKDGCVIGTTAVESSPARSILFWLFALMAVGGGLLTITRRNAVSAVMWLVATFLALAATYVLLFAHFIAVIQVLVYAGAIMVLFVFVIMILNREEEEPWAARGLIGKGLAGLALLYLLGRLVNVVYLAPPVERRLCISDDFGTTLSLGKTLFSTYLFPFEAVSIVLLIAVVGALVLAHPSHSAQGGEPDDEEPSV
jgi:NADH-quinone oxidoreductase subunit J